MLAIHRVARTPFLLAASLLIAPALSAQATAVQAPAPAAPAPVAEQVTPAPRPSPLFEQRDERAPTIAPRADESTLNSSGRHTFTMSTTVLILVVVILVLLIA